jgi:heptosyltransferase III
MRKILVLRGGALGDFLVTLPAIALLRTRWPDARIELVGNATAATLAVTRGLLDAAHSQHEARWSALFSAAPLPAELRAWLEGFDLVVNYWPDPDRDLRRRFPACAGQTFLHADAMPTQTPAAAHYCEPLRALGLETTNYFHSLAPWRGGGPIAFHPGSGSPRKNWPLARWHELIAGLDAPVLVIRGEAEAGLSLPPTVRIADNLPLESLVSELASCRLFLGHDSGVSHLAAACGVPSILLFGPTDPAMWAPPAPHVRVIQSGPDLNSISVVDVLEAVATQST